MNYFSKKTSNIIAVSSIAIIALSAILVIFSGHFINFSYDFLSQKVFHKEFSIEKWLPSIASFFLLSIFFVVVADALIFFKIPTKQKYIMITGLLVVLTATLAITVYSATYKHVNSDLGSETWLGKECVRERSLLPLGWYYSTEIRLINTQIFSALGFLFTDNWNLVKTIQSLLTCASLFFAVWYLLNQLEIKTKWLKFLICVLAASPFSETAYYVGPGYNYYIPHAIFGIIYCAVFLKIFCRKNTVKHYKITLSFFLFWAFLSGLTSIRYIMIFVLPFTVSMIVIEARDNNRSSEITNIKGFFIENKSVFFAVLGLFASGFGYICNNLIFRKLWSFSNWNFMNFSKFGETSFSDIFSGIVQIFGYQYQIAALSPGGAINVIAYIAIALFIAFLIYALKNNIKKSNRILLLFFIFSFIFNTYLYINIDYLQRYYYPIIIFVFPSLAILIENAELSSLKKYFLGISWTILLITSSFATLQMTNITDDNKDKYRVLNFLLKNGYDFGYATFGNSTVFTYLSNGKIEMGNLKKANDKGEQTTITPVYKNDTWLTPKYIYSDENHKDKKIFMLVEQGQYSQTPNLRIFSTGTLVYQDEWYRIYDYENHGAFKNGF